MRGDGPFFSSWLLSYSWGVQVIRGLPAFPIGAYFQRSKWVLFSIIAFIKFFDAPKNEFKLTRDILIVLSFFIFSAEEHWLPLIGLITHLLVELFNVRRQIFLEVRFFHDRFELSVSLSEFGPRSGSLGVNRFYLRVVVHHCVDVVKAIIRQQALISFVFNWENLSFRYLLKLALGFFLVGLVVLLFECEFCVDAMSHLLLILGLVEKANFLR